MAYLMMAMMVASGAGRLTLKGAARCGAHGRIVGARLDRTLMGCSGSRMVGVGVMMVGGSGGMMMVGMAMGMGMGMGMGVMVGRCG